MLVPTTTEHENGQSPLGRGKGREALGWVVNWPRPTPALRATPPQEGIFMGGHSRPRNERGVRLVRPTSVEGRDGRPSRPGPVAIPERPYSDSSIVASSSTGVLSLQVLLIALAKGERKDLNTGIEEFDLKGLVFYSPLLPYELIHPGLPNFAGTVSAGIDSMIVTWRRPIQGHLETNGAAVLCWT
jgi:hypothetical protein